MENEDLYLEEDPIDEVLATEETGDELENLFRHEIGEEPEDLSFHADI